ncbi:MAG: hypothetical protein EBR83_02805 [Verrucomicrobia bacterium]|jgi:hypothetical protein|nr:hypothetical protein [Verrucomicrobiota bacterium]
MTTRRNKIPAKRWRQIRVHPEEEALIRERAERYGISYPVAVRQILRTGLGLNSVFHEKPNEMGGKK